MDALEQFLGGGQASPTKWTGTTLSTQKLKQLQDAANAGDATAKDVLRLSLIHISEPTRPY